MLTLAGNTAIRRQPKPTLPSSPSSSPPAVRNLGVLALPRGFSLTVAGGIEQGSRGEALIALPAPLYAPPPAPGDPSSSKGYSEGETFGEGFGDTLGDRFGDRFGDRVREPFGDGLGDWFGHRFGGPLEDRDPWSGGVSGGSAGGGRHPLVVESGVARLEGAFNVSVTRGGGEDERWVFVQC